MTRNLDDAQHLKDLAARLEEVIGELKDLPKDGSESLGGWLRLQDTSALALAAATLRRLGLWAKFPHAEQYVDRKPRLRIARKPW